MTMVPEAGQPLTGGLTYVAQRSSQGAARASGRTTCSVDWGTGFWENGTGLSILKVSGWKTS